MLRDQRLRFRHLRRTANDDQKPERIELASFQELIKGMTTDIERCVRDLKYYLSQKPACEYHGTYPIPEYLCVAHGHSARDPHAAVFESFFKLHVLTFEWRRSVCAKL